MCQASPGPRCASHTRARVVSLHAALQKNRTNLESATGKADSIAAEGREVPAWLNRRIASSIARDKKIREDLRLAVREYDATLTGRRELESKIDSAPDETTRRRLQRRYTQAKMLAVWRKNALERSRQRVKFHPNLPQGGSVEYVSS